MNEVKAERRGEIILELDMMFKVVEQLESSMELVIKKLSFVVSPEQPAPSGKAEESSRVTACGSQLQSLRMRIHNQVETLNGLLTNLEI